MLILFAIVLTDLIGFGIVIPLLPFYAEHFGASPNTVTAVMATYSAGQLLMAPVWGRLSDRLGRRPVLLVSLVGSIFGYLWLGFADSLWVLFAARAVQGGMAGNIAAAQAYIADVTTPEKRAKGMGMIGAAFGLGFIFGPFIGGILAGSDPHHPDAAAPAFLAAGLSALAFLGTVFFLKESLPAEARRKAGARSSRLVAIRRAFERPRLRLLILLFFAITAAFSAMETTFAMWTERQFGWGPQQVSYIFVYIGLLAATIQGGLIHRLTRKYGEKRVLLAGTASIVLGLLMVPLSGTLPLLLIATGLLAIGMGLTQPSISSLISREAQAHEQGEVLGVAQSTGSFARICGPIAAGTLMGGLGRHAPYLAGAAVMAAVVVAVWRKLLGPEPEPLTEAEPVPEPLAVAETEPETDPVS